MTSTISLVNFVKIGEIFTVKCLVNDTQTCS